MVWQSPFVAVEEVTDHGEGCRRAVVRHLVPCQADCHANAKDALGLALIGLYVVA